MRSTLIIGAGIIGASLAVRLARAGDRVTVLDAGSASGGATGASFGWINASFFRNRDHFLLREDGIAAWHRLEAETGPLPIWWSGCLWWEDQGAEFDAFHTSLTELGYPAERLDRSTFSQLEPAIAAPPEQALRLPDEGAADAAQVAQMLLARAVDYGAAVFTGVSVTGIEPRGTGPCRVLTAQGSLEADRVVIAAGTGAQDLLMPLGVGLPMLRRPGVMVTTQPVAPLLSHVLVAPEQELRQLADGRILAPTSAKHQEDDTSDIVEPLADLAEQTMGRLRALLPGVDLQVETTTLAMRPVPGDGLPVVGPAGPEGVYTCVMHSGVTLAAAVAELVTRELTGEGAQNRLGPYRIDRFSA